MRAYDVPEEMVRISTKNFTVTTGLKPEYVLKVNNLADFKTPKPTPPKISNPNPENLPAVIEEKSHLGRTVAVFTIFFLIFFIVAAILSYKGMFYLFTI